MKGTDEYRPSAAERRKLRGEIEQLSILQRHEDEDLLAERFAEGIARVAEAPSALHRSHSTDEGWRLAFIGWEGLTEGAADAYRGVIERGAPPRWNPLRPAARERNLVVQANPWEIPYIPGHSEFFREHGIHDLTHTRVLVCDGPRLVAWVGTFTEPREIDRRRARWVMRAFATRLRPTLRRVLGLAQGDRADLGTALFDALPGEAYLLDHRGFVDVANALGAERLRREHAAVYAELRTAVASPQHSVFDLHPLEGSGAARVVAVRRLVHTPVLATQVERAAARWSLTVSEAKALLGLTSGLANKEIAERLGVSPRTAEVHVNSVIRKSHSESRLQVVHKVWTDG